ncbi:hypothetical protein DV20_42325 [Amycolatopsis rifamycinica]|uniref:Uncharacterized protein n=1 Tax=Amycolatopsis rifamycinica TaxID=287986 RepID=A0A066TN06_9PSEU|nr:hypothetical protein DV20_42325 [Amycolatopsis rifamycinica]
MRSFLLKCDQTWLVDQLMAAARSDAMVRARLDVAAGADPSVAFDDRELREQLEGATEIVDYVDYGDAYGYFQHVEAALEAVARLIEGGFPDAAITLRGQPGKSTTPTAGSARRSRMPRRSTWKPAKPGRLTSSPWPSAWSAARSTANTRCSSRHFPLTRTCWGIVGLPRSAA